jgi:hypothetical protein
VIDADDTSDAERLIEPYEANVTLVPERFRVTDVEIKNFSNGFTYVDDSFGSYVSVDVNFSVLDADDHEANNYTESCYARAINGRLEFEDIDIEPYEALNVMNYQTAINGVLLSSGSMPLVDKGSSKGLPDLVFSTTKAAFADEDNGSSSLQVRLNFDRNDTQVVEPIEVEGDRIDINDSEGVSGYKSLYSSDGVGAFYYGKVMGAPERQYTELSTYEAQVFYGIYMRNTAQDIAGIAGTTLPGQTNWFINVNHDDVSDGEAISFTPAHSSVVHSGTYSIADGVHGGALFTYDGTQGYPYPVVIDVNGSSWLMHNEYGWAPGDAHTSEFIIEYDQNTSLGDSIIGYKHDDSVDTQASTTDINVSERSFRSIEW